MKGDHHQVTMKSVRLSFSSPIIIVGESFVMPIVFLVIIDIIIFSWTFLSKGERCMRSCLRKAPSLKE